MTTMIKNGKIPIKTDKNVSIEIGIVISLQGSRILVWYLLLHHSDSTFLLAHFTGNLNISFRVDGMSMVFAVSLQGSRFCRLP